MELTERESVFAKTVENSAIGAVNWYLKRRLWTLMRVRRRRRHRLINANENFENQWSHRRGPVRHGFRRRKKVINPEHALDFVGTALIIARKYPLTSSIWRSCRRLVESVLENKDYMTAQEKPNEVATHLFAIIGIIDAHIEFRAKHQPRTNGHRVGRRHRRMRRHKNHNEGRYIERVNGGIE